MTFPRSVFAAFFFVSGCSTTIMRVPDAAAKNPPWVVSGYREGSVIERAFTLGPGRVQEIGRSTPPAVAANRSIKRPEPSTRSYHYQLVANGQVLEAQCEEQREPRGQTVVGYGSFTKTLSCVCSLGSDVAAKFRVVDGKGALEVGVHTWKITPIHTNVDGKKKSDALGYAFTDDVSAGALELRKHARAWPPSGIDEAAARGLSCAYAGLLLYRP